MSIHIITCVRALITKLMGKYWKQNQEDLNFEESIHPCFVSELLWLPSSALKQQDSSLSVALPVSLYCLWLSLFVSLCESELRTMLCVHRSTPYINH